MRLVVISAAVALLVSMTFTPIFIKFLRARGLAQAIRQSANGISYPDHDHKRGTPSMGGIAIVLAVALGYSSAHLTLWTPPTASGLLVIFLSFSLAAVGFVDDYTKVFKQRSGGVKARTKLIWQTLIALTFAVLAFQFVDERES